MSVQLNKQTETIAVIALIIIVIYILYKGGHLLGEGIDSIKDIFGSGTSAKSANKKIDAIDNTSDSNNPFSPSFNEALNASLVGTGKKIHYIPATTKKTFAEKIHSAAGSFSGGLLSSLVTGSKPTDILDVFKMLKYQSQVSDLAGAFEVMYSKPMLPYIVNGLRENQPLTQSTNNDMISKLIDRVNGLPKY